MGFWDWIRGVDSYDPAQRVLPEPFEPFISTAGIPVMDPGTPLEYWRGGGSQIQTFWKSQPNLRKVVDFVARNVSSIPLHLFERVSDTDRRRIVGEPLSDLLVTPAPRMGSFRFWHAVLSDGLLYDRWLVLIERRADGSVGLVHVPSWRVRFDTDPLRRVTAIRYWIGEDGQRGDEWQDVPLDSAIYDHGYAPTTAGLSPVATLRDILDETAEAVRHRREVQQNGARVPGFISRPSDAPKWEAAQRNRFVTGMRAAYGRGGPSAGGLPLLEDGMTIQEVKTFSPQDLNDIEARKLTSAEVSSAFHIAPELVGAREGTYSNVDSFRESLYRDSLGPYITAWVQAINAQLVPHFADGKRRLYVEDNIESKLKGSFTEQAKVGQTTVGAPTVSRNEWRARMNLPPIPGGDELVTPLNVLIGGQASPTDSGSQNEKSTAPHAAKSARRRVKERGDEWEVKHREVLSRFFARQADAVRTALGVKSASWWDGERWNRELSDDLFKLSTATTAVVAERALDAAGIDPDEYDADRTLAFLRAVADRKAADINGVTRQQVADAIDSDEDTAEAVARVFEVAESSRVEQMATSLVTAASGFAVTEAARQTSTGAQKTWETGPNPRAAHAAMDGETVPIDDTFSNGMQWPGDSTDADEVAGCNCGVSITF